MESNYVGRQQFGGLGMHSFELREQVHRVKRLCEHIVLGDYCKANGV